MSSPPTFRILSWNINGLRSLKSDMKQFLLDLGADILCFQETKVTRDMLEEPLAIVDGYTSYFGFSRKRSGYSGVATYCSQNAAPIHAQEGLSGILGGDLMGKGGEVKMLSDHWTDEELKDLDSEGRAIITQHTIKGSDDKSSVIAVINVYCPRVDPEKPERRVYKLRFYELLRQRAAAIQATGCHVIIVGDINTSHKRIDHCDPDETEDFEQRLERRYMDKFVKSLQKPSVSQNSSDGKMEDDFVNDKLSNQVLEDSHGKSTREDAESVLETEKEEIGPSYEYLLESASDFQVIDTFRYFYPERKDAYTCWNTFTNSRATNYGTRIDYVFCNETFIPFLVDSFVLQDVLGSDHCPVAIQVKGEVTSGLKLPSICTKFFPEFRGQQQKLSSYFQPASSLPDVKEDCFSSSDHIHNKRKNTDFTGRSKDSSKKLCSGKQSKLSSFFVPKLKSDITKAATLVSDVNKSPNENFTISQKIGGEVCFSQEGSEVLEDTDKCPASCNDSDYYLEPSQKSSIPSKSSGWGFLMQGPKPPPLCPGHKEPCALRTVKKKGPNMNRQFYACARGAGKEGDPNAQCNFFQWVGKK